MPSWKNRDAERKGRVRRSVRRDVVAERETPFHQDGPVSNLREDRIDRIERLNRTATSLGRGRSRRGGTRSADTVMSSDHELDAVANELDRLLSKREAGRSSSARTQSNRSAPARRRKAVSDEGRPDRALGAIGRLDLPFDDEPEYRVRRKKSVAPRYEYEDDFEDEFDDVDDGYEAFDAADNWDGEDHYEDDLTDAEYEALERAKARQRINGRRSQAPSSPDTSHRDLGRRIDSLREPQVEAWNMVREELGSLREAIGDVAAAPSVVPRARKQNAELRRLSDMVERLRTEQQDQRLAKEIRKEVADLKKLVGLTNVDGTLKTLEHGYAHILQRLDELTRASLDPRVLQGVTARLTEIEEAFSTLPRGDHMRGLEKRVGEISERLDDLLSSHNHEEIEAVRGDLREVRKFVEQIDLSSIVETIDERMQFVSSRLDDLETLARDQQGLDTRIAAVEERLPDSAVMTRLQDQLSDIVGMMSEGGEGSSNFGAMDSKLQDISSRLERMEKIKPVAGNADGSGIDTGLLSDLQGRIEELSKQLERPNEGVHTKDLDALRLEIAEMRKSVSTSGSSSGLEQRIEDLAELVANGTGGREDKRLDQLAVKVSALAEQLNNGGAGRGELDAITSTLVRIENNLSNTREDAVSLARDAAREVLEQGSSGAHSKEYDSAISGLQSDLRRLLDAAEGNQERTVSTFNDVQKVLGSVTDRLDRLEGGAIREATSGKGASKPAQGSFTPNYDLDQGADRQQDEVPTGEIFASKPVRRQPESQASSAGKNKKADFIAAARRAAQAAADEADALQAPKSFRGEGNESRSKSRGSWLRSALKRDERLAQDDDAIELDDDDILPDEHAPFSAGTAYRDDVLTDEEEKGSEGGRRRVILYAAAAVILALGTFQVYKLVSPATDPVIEGDKVAMVAPEEERPFAAEQEAIDEALQAPAASESSAPRAVDMSGQGGAQTPVATPTTEIDADQLADQSVDSSTNDVASVSVVNEPGKALDATSSSSVAFAPPSGVAGQFSNDQDQPASTFVKPDESMSDPSINADLPPEAVGTMALRTAAASGDPAAAFVIGVKYTEGQNVPVDLAEAAKWYQKAAEKGLAPAQYRLASLYEKGRGVTKDPAKARDWYQKAAEAGNAKAMHNLAVNYAEGAAGEPDFVNAGKWFESAANYGVKDSLFNLGILYARGLGVPKDLIASYKWFAIAADQGDQDAAQKRDDVANMMDQETLAQARLAVETFKIKTPEPSANKVPTEPEWSSQAASSINATAQNAVVRQYDKAMVLEAQRRLNDLGFDTGAPDGQLGPRTREAITAFQRSLGKPATGEVTQNLISDLVSESI
ncbi:MAG: SEL1-like repeat protein [Rhodobacteraceae bacterium]|nr:SEL1-like repeat protein [Paracoccaceae bacterium]